VRLVFSAEHMGSYTFGPYRASKCSEEHKMMDTVQAIGMFNYKGESNENLKFLLIY
jgi:hypothetical protein